MRDFAPSERMIGSLDRSKLMNDARTIVRTGGLLALIMLMTGCIVAEPRNGYYDHDHNRYYHDHGWHECGDRNEYCR